MIAIDKITMAIERMEENMRFYEAILDTTFSSFSMAGFTLYTTHVGAFEFMLCPKELARVDANINTVQLRFVVPDVAGSYEAGLATGGAELTAPAEIEGRLHASMRDPDGNSFEFVQA